MRSLYQSSVPTGRLEVPELDLHTIGDNLVPVRNENYFTNYHPGPLTGGV